MVSSTSGITDAILFHNEINALDYWQNVFFLHRCIILTVSTYSITAFSTSHVSSSKNLQLDPTPCLMPGLYSLVTFHTSYSWSGLNHTKFLSSIHITDLYSENRRGGGGGGQANTSNYGRRRIPC